MPSSFQRGEVWYVRFVDESGKRARQRTTAKGKREAEALAHELEADAERRRMGLLPKRNGNNMTLGELCRWWLDNRCPPGSLEVAESQFKTRILSEPIAELPLQQVTAAKLEAHFRHLEKVRGPHAVTINHLRGNLRAAFNKARKAGLWTGANPAADTEPRKVPKRAYETISAEEVPLILTNVPAHWRGFTAAAIYQGLRKGECAGLRKSDLDLQRDLLTIRTSYDNDTTKGKHADVVPIAPPMRPYLVAAMDSPGNFLFPDLDGAMRTPESDPQEVLRAALSRAGVVYGYDHTCRRPKCRESGGAHVERHPDKAPRNCPRKECGMRLWPVPLPRKVRFHDLRHSCATILLRAGVDPHRVQRILRHASVTTTTGTYSHLLAEDLRDAFDAFSPPADAETPLEAEAATGTDAASEPTQEELSERPASPDFGIGAQLGPKLTDPAKAKGAAQEKPAGSRALLWSGRQDLNLRPLGPELLQPTEYTVVSASTPSQALDITQGAAATNPTNGSDATPNPQSFVASLSPELRAGIGDLLPERLLVVGDVAEALQVSRATVYRLAEEGRLVHVRVGNSIRIRLADLHSYLAKTPPGPAAAGSRSVQR